MTRDQSEDPTLEAMWQIAHLAAANMQHLLSLSAQMLARCEARGALAGCMARALDLRIEQTSDAAGALLQVLSRVYETGPGPEYTAEEKARQKAAVEAHVRGPFLTSAQMLADKQALPLRKGGRP